MPQSGSEGESVDAKSSPSRYALTAAALVIVVAGLRAAQSLVVPFLLAAFLAVILTPPLHWLQRKRVPTPVALLLVFLALSVLAAGFIGLVGTSVTSFSRNLPRYQTKLSAQVEQVEGWLEEKLADLPIGAPGDDDDGEGVEGGPDAAESLGGAGLATSPSLQGARRWRIHFADPQMMMRLVGQVVGEVGALLSNAALILITVVFMLLEASRLPAKLRAVMGDSEGPLGHVDVMVANVRRYIAIKTATSALTGVLVVVFTAILGVPYAALWGLLAFLFNYIPNIGSILAAIPPVLLALVDRGPTIALAVIAGYVLVNFFVSYAIEPRYMGQGLGLSSLVVFLSLVFWGWVLGPVGMLLSAPLTMAVKIVLASFEETRWIAVFLSAKAPDEAA